MAQIVLSQRRYVAAGAINLDSPCAWRWLSIVGVGNRIWAIAMGHLSDSGDLNKSGREMVGKNIMGLQ